MNAPQSIDRPTPSPEAAVAATARRAKWVFAGFAAVGLFLLATEHRAHVLGWLPWLILLACPLMHLFMHGGHGGHRHDGDEK